MTESINQNIEELIQILNFKARELYYEESLSQLEHALQSAACAMEITENEELIVAALLHDIGHLIPNENTTPQGNIDHDELGALYLKSMNFPHSVTHLIANHVKAKRYLVTTQPDYKSKLSAASLITLEHQGAMMSDEEVARFESDPFFDDIITIRICDEKAKSNSPSPYRIEDFKPVLFLVLSKASK